MTDRYLPGSIYVGLQNGRRRFIRLGHENRPDFGFSARIYVQDCDGAGFLLNSKGRWLLKSTVASRYRLHYSPRDTP